MLATFREERMEPAFGLSPVLYGANADERNGNRR